MPFPAALAVPSVIASSPVRSSQFENNYFTEMCSGSKAGSYLRLIDLVYHSTLGLRVIKKKRALYGGSTAMFIKSTHSTASRQYGECTHQHPSQQTFIFG